MSLLNESEKVSLAKPEAPSYYNLRVKDSDLSRYPRWLYVAAEVPCSGLFKVGIAVNLMSRLAGLQTGNPRTLEIAFAFACRDRATAKIAESVVHDLMADFRVGGEWFKAEPAWILDTIDDYASVTPGAIIGTYVGKGAKERQFNPPAYTYLKSVNSLHDELLEQKRKEFEAL